MSITKTDKLNAYTYLKAERVDFWLDANLEKLQARKGLYRWYVNQKRFIGSDNRCHYQYQIVACSTTDSFTCTDGLGDTPKAALIDFLLRGAYDLMDDEGLSLKTSLYRRPIEKKVKSRDSYIPSDTKGYVVRNDG